MAAGKVGKWWALITIFLVAVIVTSGIVDWSRYSKNQPIEISISPSPKLQGEIYIGGAVINPGFYPLKARDGIEDIIEAAGGVTSSADLSRLKLYIPEAGEEIQPQKINLNRAEAWLLEALPGIGKERAQAIIDYRQQKGLFGNINELTKVEGIGTNIYEQIKHLITVAD